MIDWLRDFFSKGDKNTINMRQGANFSYSGPWVKLVPLPSTTKLDEFFLGQFAAAEYTIVADYDFNNRETVKCLVTAGQNEADVTIYGRSNLGQRIIDIDVEVNNSSVKVSVKPQNDDSTDMSGAKVFFAATYFKAVNPPTA